MTEAKFIRLEPANRGLDYEWLKARGQELIQKLAGEVWTDYNEHDPGVTTLEQLCYALTELSYRAQLPMEDLLTARENERIDGRNQGLFAPSAILSCNPVTEGDYRKLIADRVEAIANVWFSRCRGAARVGASGLYDVELYVPRLDRSRFAATRRQVRRIYSSHRNLCEDVHAVHILSPVPAVLGATITIDSGYSPELVLASLFYRVGHLLAPELRRQSLQTLLDGKKMPAVMFEGPALRNGFVSDDQLQPRPTEFTISQVIQCVIGTEGIARVQHVSVATEGAGIEAGGRTSLAVPRNSILQLDTRPVGDRFSIRVMRGGVEYTPSASLVARELVRLWADHRRKFDVRADAARLLAIPGGQYSDVGTYVSIQEQYPTVYGVNRYGVGSEATPERRAQARQFKAYLLAFEQLLADSFARLEGLKRLCAIGRGSRQRAFSHYLDACDSTGATLVPDVAPLLKDSYRTGLATLSDHRDRLLERRNRFLDFMLATYGEGTDPVIPPSVPREGAPASASSAQRLRTKLEFLRRLTRIGRDRGRGGDYVARQPARQLAGLECKTRLQLGMDLATPPPLAQLLGDLRVSLQDAAPSAEYQLMRTHGAYIDNHFALMPLTAAATSSASAGRPITMTEELLVAAGDIGNYRIGTLPGDASVTVVCRAPLQRAWQRVGRYEDYESAIADVRSRHRLASDLRQKARRLYIVEHLLLRGHRGPQADDNVAGFEYSLTATAVVCLPGREADDPGYREHVREVIRANAPAHVVMNTSFLRFRHVAEFERLYAAWQQKLAARGDPAGLETSCRELREFLMPTQS